MEPLRSPTCRRSHGAPRSSTPRPCAGASSRWRAPTTCSSLMDTGAEGVVALVRDAGATFLAPIYHELTGIICTSGTGRSHIGIVSREFQVPCVMGATFSGDEPRRASRSSSTAPRRRGGGPWLTPRHAGPAQPTHRLPRTDLAGAHPGAHVARERPDPGHRLHRRGCAESYLRYPEMMASASTRRCRRRRSAAGRAAPGCQVDPCYLWSIANFFLLGRKIMAMVDPQGDDPRHCLRPRLLGPRALAYRGDGTRQAWDTGTSRSTTPPPSPPCSTGRRRSRRRTPSRREAVQRHARQPPVPALLRHSRPATATPARTRCPASPGQTLLVRDYYRLAHGDFPWSDVARGVPYHHLTAPWCSTTCAHLHRLRYVEPHAGGLPRPPRRLRPLHRRTGCHRASCAPSRPTSTTASSPPCAPPRPSTTATSRRWTGTRRSGAGAYVYFSFLRPFAEVAGVADELDWSVPRDLPEPLYQLMSAMQGENAGIPEDEAYYDLYPQEPREPAPARTLTNATSLPTHRGGATVGRVVVLRLHRS